MRRLALELDGLQRLLPHLVGSRDQAAGPLHLEILLLIGLLLPEAGDSTFSQLDEVEGFKLRFGEEAIADE